MIEKKIKIFSSILSKNNKSKVLIFAMLSVAIIFSTLFVSAATFANPATVDLGEAGNFAVLSSTAITDDTTNETVITGDIGVSPAAATFITGLICDEVVGTIHVVSAGGETLACQTVDPLYLTPTILEYEAAYTDATGRAPDATISTALDGLTYTRGVYTAADLDLSNDANVTLDCEGDATGVFIFMTAGHLSIGTNAHVNLIGGCQTGNIFWAVAGATAILGGDGTESLFQGTVIAGQGVSGISLGVGSTVNGRLMSDKTIALLGNIITLPAEVTVAAATVATESHHHSGTTCITKWVCTEWNTCVNDIQTRTCSYRTNWCKPTSLMPALSQSCITIVTPEPIIETPETPSVTDTETTTPSEVISERTLASKIGIGLLVALLVGGIVYLIIKLFSKVKK